MKLIPLFSLVALFSVTACSHMTKSCCAKKEATHCSKEKKKECCKEKKECKEGSCPKTEKKKS